MPGNASEPTPNVTTSGFGDLTVDGICLEDYAPVYVTQGAVGLAAASIAEAKQGDMFTRAMLVLADWIWSGRDDDPTAPSEALEALSGVLARARGTNERETLSAVLATGAADLADNSETFFKATVAKFADLIGQCTENQIASATRESDVTPEDEALQAVHDIAKRPLQRHKKRAANWN